MSDGGNEPLRPIPFKVTDPERIPVERYYDPEFFELERKYFWPKVWQMACRLEEIPEVGDWIEYRILEKSVIVINTRNGIKAFHNACRHRGVQLASGHGNCKGQGFICPFHGWRFNEEGENTFVYGRGIFSEEALDQADINLVPCRVELWGGCAYINFDDDAPPFVDTIKPIAATLEARNVDKLKVEWWMSTILPTNWKTAMEGFMEGYHVMKTHPQLFSAPIGDNTTRYGTDTGEPRGPARASKTGREKVLETVHHQELLSEGMAGMVHAKDLEVAHDLLAQDIDFPEDPGAAVAMFQDLWHGEVTRRAQARGEPMPDLNYLRKNIPYEPTYFMFPHIFVLPMFGNMSAYRIRPLTPETCLFELWSLIFYPEGEKRERPVAPTPVPYKDSFPAVPQQDYSNLPLQQLGLHAEGFKFMRLSKHMEGLISNYQRVIDGFLQGVDSHKLVKGMQITASKLDVPIQDIGI